MVERGAGIVVFVDSLILGVGLMAFFFRFSRIGFVYVVVLVTVAVLVVVTIIPVIVVSLKVRDILDFKATDEFDLKLFSWMGVEELMGLRTYV